MAKAIYMIKIFLFRKQLKLTANELKAVTNVSLFVSLLYCLYWHEAPIAAYAPKNDFDFMKDLEAGLSDRASAKVALNALQRHLWYLSEELVGLAFFDERISYQDKRKMVEKLDTPERKGLKRLERKNLSLTALHDCTTERTRRVFDAILPNGQEKSLTFLAMDPSKWEDDATYQEFKNALKGMTVVNDTAERAIALATNFNKCLTRDESQKQYLLKLVAKHRKDMPSVQKSLFV